MATEDAMVTIRIPRDVYERTRATLEAGITVRGECERALQELGEYAACERPNNDFAASQSTCDHLAWLLLRIASTGSSWKQQLSYEFGDEAVRRLKAWLVALGADPDRLAPFTRTELAAHFENLADAEDPHRACPDCREDCIAWVADGVRCRKEWRP